MAPLIAMLGQGDVQLREMAAFALGRLAQNADNQAGVVEVQISCHDVWLGEWKDGQVASIII